MVCGIFSCYSCFSGQLLLSWAQTALRENPVQIYILQRKNHARLAERHTFFWSSVGIVSLNCWFCHLLVVLEEVDCGAVDSSLVFVVLRCALVGGSACCGCHGCFLFWLLLLLMILLLLPLLFFTLHLVNEHW